MDPIYNTFAQSLAPSNSDDVTFHHPTVSESRAAFAQWMRLLAERIRNETKVIVQ